jgi:hypothetical protein
LGSALESAKTELTDKIDNIQLLKGDKGEKGDTGSPGIDGKDGVDGKDGKDGKDGLNGKNGAQGERGEQGIPGKDGLNGKDVDMSEIEALKKEIEELKSRPVRGGGTSALGVQQAFKWILKTESPVGLINGVNTEYTVSQTIFAVLAFSLNGEVICQLPNYTISKNKITFATALPSAYAGKDFECKYV